MVAMFAAGMAEFNFGDSEFLMLFLVLMTLPYAAKPETGKKGCFTGCESLPFSRCSSPRSRLPHGFHF